MIRYLIIEHQSYKKDISEEEFEQLKKAKKHLLEFLFIEEKLELVLANYSEIEREAFNISLKNMMTYQYDWSSNMDNINIINLKIVNFLTTTRLYIDQSRRAISLIYGKDSNQFKRFKEKCSKEYDSHLSYRAMEAIRNHVQHYSLPVDGIIRGNQAIEDKSENFLRKNYIQIYSNISALAENKDFKKCVLNELKQSFKEKIDLMLLIRQYLESLGEIHGEVRQLLATDSLDWENIINDQLGTNEFLTAFKFDDATQTIIEQTDLFCDIIKRRKKLQDKNRHLTHYSFHFISNETQEL